MTTLTVHRQPASGYRSTRSSSSLRPRRESAERLRRGLDPQALDRLELLFGAGGQVVELGRIEALIYLARWRRTRQHARLPSMPSSSDSSSMTELRGERCLRRPLGLSRAAFSAAHPPRTL